MTTREFLISVDKDADLSEKIKALKNRTDVYNLAKGKGLTDDENTFVAEAKKYLAEVGNMSEKDIEGISAGFDTIYVVATTSATVGAAAITFT